MMPAVLERFCVAKTSRTRTRALSWKSSSPESYRSAQIAGVSDRTARQGRNRRRDRGLRVGAARQGDPGDTVARRLGRYLRHGRRRYPHVQHFHRGRYRRGGCGGRNREARQPRAVVEVRELGRVRSVGCQDGGAGARRRRHRPHRHRLHVRARAPSRTQARGRRASRPRRAYRLQLARARWRTRPSSNDNSWVCSIRR